MNPKLPILREAPLEASRMHFMCRAQKSAPATGAGL
jgi:hypothetical protein